MRSPDEAAAYRSSLEKPGVRFVNSVLRGVGQVMFQDNPITGIPVLGGILFESCIFGLYAFPAILPVLTRRYPLSATISTLLDDAPEHMVV
jgi:urea transporter